MHQTIFLYLIWSSTVLATYVPGKNIKWSEGSMQSRWKLDEYLSYLSSPPLPCYYSSLWSPAKRKGSRKKKKKGTERGGKRSSKKHGEREKKRNSKTKKLNLHLWWGLVTLDTCPTWTHRQMDGWTPPSQEHKPAWTAARGSATSHTHQSNPLLVNKVCEYIWEHMTGFQRNES